MADNCCASKKDEGTAPFVHSERCMHKPQENPEGYTDTNLVAQADKLKGKLLLVHGLQDPVIAQECSVAFVRAAFIKKGTSATPCIPATSTT